jgi:hypothetical protein
MDERTKRRMVKARTWVMDLQSECGTEDREYIDAWIKEAGLETVVE